MSNTKTRNFDKLVIRSTKVPSGLRQRGIDGLSLHFDDAMFRTWLRDQDQGDAILNKELVYEQLKQLLREGLSSIFDATWEYENDSKWSLRAEVEHVITRDAAKASN